MFDCRTGIYRMTGLLCPFAFSVRRKGRKLWAKRNQLLAFHYSVNAKSRKNKTLYIYGSENTAEKEQDCFAKALSRYMSDSGPDNKKVSARKLHILSGVSKSAIYYYLLGVRRITYETLCAICIALRLHPVRQEHLFRKAHIMMPCDEPYPSKRDRIIKYYLDNCAFIERCTVIACNKELTSNDCDALNELTSDKEDSE